MVNLGAAGMFGDLCSLPKMIFFKLRSSWDPKKLCSLSSQCWNLLGMLLVEVLCPHPFFHPFFFDIDGDPSP